MTQDEYGTVVNSKDTYSTLAMILKSDHAVVLAWTDGEGTQLDILLALTPVGYGHLQRGMKPTDLFVAVSHFGMFGFDVNNHDTHYTYIGEKLNLGTNTTSEKLAELINGVRKELSNGGQNS